MMPEPDRWIQVENANAGIWFRGPTWNNQNAGLIGHYSASDPESGLHVLQEACRLLRAQGLAHALGPINGSTWFSYRLVTDSSQAPPFLLEPHTPAAYVDYWKAAGFEPVLHYRSGLCTAYTPSPKAAVLAERFEHMIEPPNNIETALGDLYTLSLEAFAENPLYTPISKSAFDALYKPLLQSIPLDWLWLAKDPGSAGQLAGFGFAYPDPGGALVIKTVAVRPGRAYAGLGRYLTERYHAQAFGKGFKQVVHALMHESNASINLASRYGSVMRRYAVFGKQL
jgi:hypothetical protein